MGTPGKPGEDRGVATGREPELSCCRPCSPLEQRSALASWRPREVGGRGSPAAFAPPVGAEESGRRAVRPAQPAGARGGAEVLAEARRPPKQRERRRGQEQ